MVLLMKPAPVSELVAKVTTARFVTKVTKHEAMPARFVINEVVTNRVGIAPFFFFCHLEMLSLIHI